MFDVRRRSEQMKCFHHAVVGIQGHHDSIFGVPARNNRYIAIGNHLIDHLLELVSSFRKINDSHVALSIICLIYCTSLSPIENIRKPPSWAVPLPPNSGRNTMWALDFMYDTLYYGRPFRTLNVIVPRDSLWS